MSAELPITDDLVEACLQCPRKAYLRLTGAAGQSSEYVALQRTLDEEHRAAARAAWLRRRPLAMVAADPPSIAAACGSQIITGLTLSDAGEACRFDALERIGGTPGAAPRAGYTGPMTGATAPTRSAFRRIAFEPAGGLASPQSAANHRFPARAEEPNRPLTRQPGLSRASEAFRPIRPFSAA